MNRWFKIGSFYHSGVKGLASRAKDARTAVKKLVAKFPNVKFKIGKPAKSSLGWREVSVLALLPTPHPNSTTFAVVEYLGVLSL